ncbi:MAG: GNAT family N-acetyltransferase [Nitrospiraceae bacterium]|nr:GNAT family N-acetyltransferase [Nitrospiraceae bacterium]
MSIVIQYRLNTASSAEIAEHLLRCDAHFVPPLSGRVEIDNYARKIANKATRFEAWSGDKLLGLIAAYCNDRDSRIAYITSVSILQDYVGKGISNRLMNQCVEYAKAADMRQISLEVAVNNKPAIKLYEKSGFVAGKSDTSFVCMHLSLTGSEAEHE